jgi:hypothetical protein
MQDVKIDKETLIAQIEANMKTHQATYEKAVEVFTRKQTELLEDLLAKARAGRGFDRLALSRMPVPENHLEDYEVALEMLRLDLRNTIELEYHDYRKYYRDEWEWQRSFLANTTSYSLEA